MVNYYVTNGRGYLNTSYLSDWTKFPLEFSNRTWILFSSKKEAVNRLNRYKREIKAEKGISKQKKDEWIKKIDKLKIVSK